MRRGVNAIAVREAINTELQSALAFGAEMGSAAGDHDTTNRRLAAAAGLAGAQVDAVFELEETAGPVGVNVV